MINCGVVGYGMGKTHCRAIKATEGLKFKAVCDLKPESTKAAKADFPEIETYNDLSDMLNKSDIEMVTVATPHNTHAEIAMKCLKAGRHVIVEKPMCITVQEATDMINAARKSGTMLSVSHQRRYDKDFLAIKEVIGKGLIGDVFQIETFKGSYKRPEKWKADKRSGKRAYRWRSDKEISGGAFYDWGAHFIDWILNIVPGRVRSVTGFFHKLMWHDVTNEDQVRALIQFENEAVADVQISDIAWMGKPRWQILGTKGAILVTGERLNERRLSVRTEVKGFPAEIDLEPEEPKHSLYKQFPLKWSLYYKNIAAHLLKNEPLPVTPESARRVIAIIQTAEKSSNSGKTEPVPYE